MRKWGVTPDSVREAIKKVLARTESRGRTLEDLGISIDIEAMEADKEARIVAEMAKVRMFAPGVAIWPNGTSQEAIDRVMAESQERLYRAKRN